MKINLLIVAGALLTLTGCDMIHRINQTTCDINQNADAVDRSTEAIYRNLDQLEKVRGSK